MDESEEWLSDRKEKIIKNNEAKKKKERKADWGNSATY